MSVIHSKARGALVFAAVFASLATLAPEAHAECDQYGSCHDDESSDTSGQPDEAEIGVALDLFRAVPSSSGLYQPTNGDSYGVRTSMHARVGRRIALGLGMEEAAGTDPSGYRRYDLAWSMPDLFVYLTPRSKFQLYTVTGMKMRVSHFESGPGAALPTDVPWGAFYMGGTLGAGVETRMNKSTALRFELRGFLLGRVDGQQEAQKLAGYAEYSEATRSSKGVSFSIGMVFF